MGMNTWHLWEVAFQQLIGPHHEVALFVALHIQVGHLYVAIYRGWELGVHHRQFECILYVDGIEHGFQIVVTVGAAFHYVQSQVDFCYWKCYHILS